MRKKLFLSLFITIYIALALPHPALAQDSDYRISLRKDFGYSMGGDIRGTFSMRLIGDEEPVEKVTFIIDDEAIDTITEAPFRLQFHTDDYSLGVHSLTAEITLQDGTILQTEPIQANFISADKEGKFVSTTLIGIFGAILVSFLIVAIIQTFIFKKKKGSNGPHKNQYGLLGGTICPKCGKPFPRHIWGMNLVVGRLDRCDHCGKWVMATRATPAALEAAEDLIEGSPTPPEEAKLPPEKTLEQRLEDSKYLDR
jgi:hypothetical protein